MVWYSVKGTCCLQFLLCSHARLQDLTIRDLEKQEREKSANSLESFIFETQVRGIYRNKNSWNVGRSGLCCLADLDLL